MFQRNFLFEHQILSIFFDNSFLFYARFHWSAVPANFLKTLYALDNQKDAFPETMLLILIYFLSAFRMFLLVVLQFLSHLGNPAQP